MFALLRLSILSYFIALTTSCTTTVILSPQYKQRLHSITVNEKITYSSKPYYMGPSGVRLLVFATPIVGGVLARKIDAEKETQLAKFAEKNHIAIDHIVKEQMINAIKEKTRLKIVKQNADADLKISILLYGFSIPTQLSFSIVPVLSIRAELFRNNQVIWKSYYYVDALFGGMGSYSTKEIFTDPVKLKTAWMAVAHKAAENIVKTLS